MARSLWELGSMTGDQVEREAGGRLIVLPDLESLYRHFAESIRCCVIMPGDCETTSNDHRRQKCQSYNPASR